MAKPFSRLLRTDHNEPITPEKHSEFLHHLQSALLLSLRERGRLTAMEYRYASETLDRQRRDRARALLKKDLSPG